MSFKVAQRSTPSRPTARLGSGNVFAGLGLPGLTNASPANQIATTIHSPKLTDQHAAQRIGIALPELSGLLLGRVRSYSVARLRRILIALL
jgi:hypothetical protein